MKRLSGLLVISFVALLLFVGCASEPTQEINDAKAVIEAATTEGAATYCAAELATINDRLTTALDKAKENTGKLFKSNQEAKDLLIQIKADAEALKATIPAKKEEAKNNAVNALAEVKTLVDETKVLVENAPTGKDSQAEIEAFKADLAAIEAAMAATQGQIDAENFFGAVESCPAMKEKVTAIADQVKAAIEKIEAQKGKRKK
jgi:small-conductance mechanosensitive channel